MVWAAYVNVLIDLAVYLSGFKGICHELVEAIEMGSRKEQYCFIMNKRCADQVFVVEQLCGENKENRKMA